MAKIKRNMIYRTAMIFWQWKFSLIVVLFVLYQFYLLYGLTGLRYLGIGTLAILMLIAVCYEVSEADKRYKERRHNQW